MKKGLLIFIISMILIIIFFLINIFSNLNIDNIAFNNGVVIDNVKVNVENIATNNIVEDIGRTYDGKIKGEYNNPIIPKGFVPIDTETSKWENVREDYINGMVIEDITNTDTKGSQFVWIPVIVSENENFEDVFVRTYYINGNFKEISSNYYETFPDQTRPSELKQPTKGEVTEMYNSVKQNGGFYIARYEAGKLKDYPVIDGSEKPVSLPNIKVWNDIPWGGNNSEKASDGYLGDDTKDGAVKVARSMYLNENVGVKSTLVYGVQWDAIMKFVKSKFSDENNIIENNNKILKLTGVECINNIYDLFTNVSEHTMEANIGGRIIRGANYEQQNIFEFYQPRISLATNLSFSNVGFRVALYIKIQL